MKPTRPFFAFRLFQWFVSRQVLISAGLFLCVDIGMIVWLQTLSGVSRESVALAEKVALISFAISFLVVCFVSLYMTLRLVLPLGRLVEKTKRLRKMPFDSDEENEIQFTNDVPGEWFELERALNKLGRELQKKTIRLSR